ncbi:MAG: hypothetical protein QUV06_02505 [Cyanobium sp. CZS 48M]|nr:hypothetical protein [Cyanobium sp. CZS48M]
MGSTLGSRLNLPVLAWGSAQASTSLTLAATAWMVSGLNPSPLLNSLLPALVTLPALLPLIRRPLAGVMLQLLAVLVLMGVGVSTNAAVGSPAPASSAAVLLAMVSVLAVAMGTQMTALPLQRTLLKGRQRPMAQLRRAGELGALLGHALTALLFPIGRALLQFSQALVLLLPVLPLARQARGEGRIQAPGAEGPLAPVAFSWRCALQGVLFGGLFGLLPLWVRQVEAGTCLDFGLVLAAYGLGRSLGGDWGLAWWPAARPLLGTRLEGGLRYLALALLLGATRWLPGWGALLLFLPMGGLAQASDLGQVRGLRHLGDAPLRWQTLARSGAIGGLLGSLAMGVMAQLLGLPVALPVQIGLFMAAALLLPPTLVQPAPLTLQAQ